jgi:hypothetical protein
MPSGQGGAESAGRRPAARANAPAPETLARAFRGEPPQWEAQFLHVSFAGNGVYVSVRDGRLGPGSGLKVLQALRRELTSLGLDLASFTLNGEQLAPPEG